MNRCNWVVCERSSRWAAALRAALARRAVSDDFTVDLHEVRNLDELTARLGTLPNTFAYIEVTSKNFEATLAWLAAATRNSEPRAVAMLDRDFADASEVASVLREAGALEITCSPRQLQHVMQLGRCCAEVPANGSGRKPAPGQSIDEWAWRLLPWQDARRPLG